ncbi:MAG: hypothetical protein ACYC3F_16660 [Gemmatimonadaceae bacterium]
MAIFYQNNYRDRLGLLVETDKSFTNIFVDEIAELTPGHGIEMINDVILDTVSPNSALFTDSARIITGAALVDGGLLIGALGAAPAAGVITSSNGSIVVTLGPNTIDITTGSSGIFNDIALLNNSNQIAFGTGNVATLSITPSASYTLTIPDTAGASSFVMTTTNQSVGGDKTWLGVNSFGQGIQITNVAAPGFSAGTAYIYRNTADNALYYDQTGITSHIFRNNSGNTIGTFNSAGLNTLKGLFASAGDQLVLGTTTTTAINCPNPAVSLQVTIPDAGVNSSFVLTELAQTINAQKTFSTAPISPGLQRLAGNMLLQVAGSASYDFLTTSVGSASIRWGRNSVVDGVLAIANANNDWVNSSIARDIVIQPQVNTQTIWVGVNANQYLSSSNSQTRIYPTTASTSTTTGSLVNNGGFGNAGRANFGADVLVDDQLYLNVVTSPSNGIGTACIAHLNTANTQNNDQLVCFAASDSAAGAKFSLLGPNYLALGTFPSLTSGAAGQNWFFPIGVNVDPWAQINLVGTPSGFFTVQKTGYYELHVQIIAPIQAGGYYILALWKNFTTAGAGPYSISGGTLMTRSTIASFNGGGVNTLTLFYARSMVIGETYCLSIQHSTVNNVVYNSTESTLLWRQIR